MATKPLPVPDESSQEFWDAAARHQLVIQRCDHCGHYAHPPTTACAKCLHPEATFTFTPVSGKGTLKTWTVMYDAFVPGFREEIPYVIADVELAEQPQLRYAARLLDDVEVERHQGDPVEVAFEDRAPGVSIPAFRLASSAGGAS